MPYTQSIDALSSLLSISPKTIKLVQDAESGLDAVFKKIESVSAFNQAKVLSAFQKNKISGAHFCPTTGYGYDDLGREKLSALFACIFGGEDAIVSPHLLSGTHAIYLALSALLNAGDTILSVYGRPYDTLATAIGVSEKKNSTNTLISRGFRYEEIDLTGDGGIDIEQIKLKTTQIKPKIIYIQRSRGYVQKRSLIIQEIKTICDMVHALSPDSLIVCDNCYGEFCETKEPLEAGADIIIGSLIKNPGGGIAPNGGYIAGKKVWIKTIAERMTAPGIGAEVGSYGGSYLPFFQGIFLAPHVVAESLKAAVLAAKVMADLGHRVLPKWDDFRTDITQSIQFMNEDQMIAFIQGIQAGSPVDSHVKPVPWDMPGYDDPVIMAAGTFIQGASIELSADAPIKKPCIAYMQGGLTYQSAKFGLMTAIDRMNSL